MTPREAVAWVAAQAGRVKPGVLADLSERIELLAASTAGEDSYPDYVEAAVGSRHLFRRAKLVHVCRYKLRLPKARREALARKREKALVRLFRGLPGFKAAEVERMFAAVRAAGIKDFLPVASVECGLATGVFDEVSLYSDDQPGPLAEPLCRSLGAAPPAKGEVPWAVGYDFGPGRPCRVKLYCVRPIDEIRSDPGTAVSLAQFPEKWFSEKILTLFRRAEGGEWERGKVYLSYVARFMWYVYCAKDPSACQVRSIAAQCPPGPLKRFMDALSACAPDHVVDYIGADGAALEAYIGLPPLTPPDERRSLI